MSTWLRYLLIALLACAAVVVLTLRRRSWRLDVPLSRVATRKESALAVTVIRWLLLALSVAVAAGAALLWAFGWPKMPSAGAFDTGQMLDLLRIVLTVVAGLGGVVLLAVNTRKQRVTEAEHQLAVKRADRERAQGFNERFGTAAEQLAHQSAAVRLAGAYAMAGLADEWQDQRQVCVDVLCGYLRVPKDADEGEEQVREAVLRVIRARLADRGGWNGLAFDFTGMDFDDADFSGLRFDGDVSFDGVKFTGELTSFRNTKFQGGFSCHGALFAAKTTTFAGASCDAAKLEFVGTEFGGVELDFSGSTQHEGSVDFHRCFFDARRLNFSQYDLIGGGLRFSRCEFADAELDFSLLNQALFPEARGVGQRLTIEDSRLTDCLLDLRWAAGQPRLWWLADRRLERVAFKVIEDGQPWLNARDVELIDTELPEACVRQRPKP